VSEVDLSLVNLAHLVALEDGVARAGLQDHKRAFIVGKRTYGKAAGAVRAMPATAEYSC
jgi:hypothetical protein